MGRIICEVLLKILQFATMTSAFGQVINDRDEKILIKVFGRTTSTLGQAVFMKH